MHALPRDGRRIVSCVIAAPFNDNIDNIIMQIIFYLLAIEGWTATAVTRAVQVAEREHRAESNA